MAKISFRNVNKLYSKKNQVVFDFNLEVNDNEIIVIVGPSGCGKSTILRMIAGLEDITSGEIYIDDVLINDLAPKDRNIAMVFQNYALYTNMTVFENMAFSLRVRKEYFPIMKYDFLNPEYLKKEEEIESKFKLLFEEGLNVIEKDEELSKTLKKDRILELKYRIQRELQSEIETLKNEYTYPVMTYDEHRVNSIKAEIERLKMDTSVNDKAILEKNIELSAALNDFCKIKMQYRNYNTNEIKEKVIKVARTLGLEPYLRRKPSALSGGQKQRVALGRAIVRNPKVFLMDEPLSNLDAKLRIQMQKEIVNIHKKVNATTIYVTHDQTEAMALGDRIVCMKDGVVQQIGTPEEIYNEPKTLFVASFIGEPPMNLIHGRFDGKKFISDNDLLHIELDSERLAVMKDYEQQKIVLGIRPEEIYPLEDASAGNKSIKLELICEFAELFGRKFIIHALIGDNKVIAKVDNKVFMSPGERRLFAIDMDRLYFFSSETEGRII